jgi:hypothetical protein
MNESARKSTTFLIVIVLVSLLGFAAISVLGQKQNQRSAVTTGDKKTSTTPIPQVEPRATLVAIPSKTQVSQQEEFTIEIKLATNTYAVTGVQLELTYDPAILSISAITPGGFFPNPLEYAQNNDTKKGHILYAVGSFDGKTGEGIVATLVAKAHKGTNGPKEVLTIAPTTLVTADGVEPSILKEGKGATIVVR